MKRSLKKTPPAILFAITAIFGFYVNAWSDPVSTKTVQGQYYLAGGGTGLIALEAITHLESEPRVAWVADSFSWEGVCTLTPDGGGTATATQFHTQRTGPAATHQQTTFMSKLTWKFTYAIGQAGKIIFTVVPGSYSHSLISGSQFSSHSIPAEALPMEGAVHADGEFITALSPSQELINIQALKGIPVAGVPNWNTSIVLVKQHD